jgi:16S rRNA (uracil1498-N3)-methyltransferase
LNAAAKAHAFVADLDAPALDDLDRYHLERVLRLRPGDEITVSDGRGGWRPCRFGPALEPIADPSFEAAPTPSLTIGFALVKSDKPELVVQKLTELGIDRIVPFTAARSVVRWDAAKVAKAHIRLNGVAREASMQSRRTWLPTVERVASFADVAGDGAVLCERGGAAPSLARTTFLVGPEGGWSSDERALGLPEVGLGPNVLRAETAAVALGAVLGGLRAGIIGRHAE